MMNRGPGAKQLHEPQEGEQSELEPEEERRQIPRVLQSLAADRLGSINDEPEEAEPAPGM